VVADVGGPYILAPVSGSLRYRGRTVGRYTLSVQDDLGYVKLVTRFLGVPLAMRAGAGSLPVEGLLDPAPPRIPAHGRVTYRGRRYQAFSFGARAFPAGPLRISLLVPLSGVGSSRSCANVRTAELGRIAERISRRFALSPSTLPAYLKVTRTLTGALVYVRAGSSTVAGSALPGPSRMPLSGSVSYRGRRYQVASFTAPSSLGPLHVYVLVR
jgi:hypothetical protein